MKRFLNAALFLTFLATFTGCGKDGINGVDGKDGLGGNANLEHYTVTIQPNQWLTRGVFSTPGYQYYTDFNVPGITQAVMQSGAVMVYIKLDDLFYPLPAITNNDGYVSTIQNNVYLGLVEIFMEDTDFQTEAPGAYTFKVVVFDQLKSLPKSLDIKDFKQVEAYMNK
jgi:hypothetical protein